MPVESRLFGGPQDGARVRGVGGPLPERIHVGLKWLGDGYAAWGYRPSPRFPACYHWTGHGYLFSHWHKG